MAQFSSSDSPTPEQSEQLLICAFAPTEAAQTTLCQQLDDDRYQLLLTQSQPEFINALGQQRDKIDCLVLHDTEAMAELVQWLHNNATLLPAVIIQLQPIVSEDHNLTHPELALTFLYHTAEIRILANQPQRILGAIDEAIGEFLNFSPTCRINRANEELDPRPNDPDAQNFVLVQQRRLAQKLKERLGYLGVYYQRNPKVFFRSMTLGERQAFLAQMQEAYQEVVLTYFDEDPKNNQKIDTFVDSAFFADLSVAQVVEIHIDLINEFSKQLKLEGRSEEILLDYRLTLIDVIAHLCEMYRRSVPREIPDQDNSLSST
jgi:circadian clock protein KaiA